jgi:fucose 4-O-acetylase-like acetyltransferase
MTYNLTSIYENKNPMMILAEVNSLSGNLFANFILLCVFVIIWVSTSNSTNANKMIISGFITSFLGVLLLSLEMTTFPVIIIPFCIFVAGSLMKVFKDSPY